MPIQSDGAQGSALAPPVISLNALAQELKGDPAGLGYATPLSKGDADAVLDLLNVVRDGAEYQIVRGVLSYSQFAASNVEILFKIYSLPEGDEKTKLLAYIQVFKDCGQVDLSNDAVRAKLDEFQSIFGGKSELDRAIFRQGSRAEFLFGPGAIVPLSDLWAIGAFKVG